MSPRLESGTCMCPIVNLETPLLIENGCLFALFRCRAFEEPVLLENVRWFYGFYNTVLTSFIR